MLKLDNAKIVYEKALKRKQDNDAEEKVEAYNSWRMAEEKKGKAQDEHARKLVKVMLEAVRSASPPEPVTESMCNVMGNLDGIFLKMYC